jgi:beta-glucosidase
MNQKQNFFIAGLLSILLFSSCSHQTSKLSQDKIDQKVENLLKKMSLEEEVGQMTQITLGVLMEEKTIEGVQHTYFNPEKLKLAFQKYKIGSVLNTYGDRAQTLLWWNSVVDSLQQASIKASGIPLIYGIDAIHGTTYTAGGTLFPQQIGQGATFNPGLVKKMNEVTAYEVRASGIAWDFSPVLDMGRDARDPRMWETYGEDVYENSCMAKAAVEGLQGSDNGPIDHQHVAACLKHFIAYNSTSGKDRTPLSMGTRDLLEKDVPDFQAGIDAGAKTIMVNSGILNGVPVHSSYQILTQLLRNEMGFQGVAVTDWADIENLYLRDRVASSQKEAVKMAIQAGIDMAMVPNNFTFADHLIQLVHDGEISRKRIDSSVRRILKLKFELGLFEHPVTYRKDYPKFADEQAQNLALNAARESMTLLKNNKNILPLSKSAKVLVTGPNANSMRPLNGGWSYSWQGSKADQFAGQFATIFEAIQQKVGKRNVRYVPGVTYKMHGKYFEENSPQLAQAIAAARQSDVVVLCVGENSYTEKPGDLDDLYLSENQTRLALAMANTGKPVILVLNEGRPRIISKFENKMAAVLQAYLPGNYGGQAVADVLFGDVNPSGKLPYTYPEYPNSLTHYDYKPSENPSAHDQAFDYSGNITQQYAFGAGLSYTSFQYSDFQIDKDTLRAGDTLHISVRVKNSGKRAGKEVVMLYSADRYASITPDNKRLQRFLKIDLQAGESKTVRFSLSARDLSFINRTYQRVAEKGDFVLVIKHFQKSLFLTDDVRLGKASQLRL